MWRLPGKDGGSGQTISGSGQAISGVEFSEGVGGLFAWAVRPLAWGGLCMPAWGRGLGSVKKPATPAGQALLAEAKTAVGSVRKGLGEAVAASLRMTKALEASTKAAPPPSAAGLIPELESKMEGIQEERASLAKGVAASKEQALKGLRAMLLARQDALAAPR